MPKRRDILTKVAVGGVAILAGCAGSEQVEGKTPRIEVKPQNPQVGTQTTLTAYFEEVGYSNNRNDPDHYYWSFGSNRSVDAQGETITTQFKEPGQQLVRVLAINDSILRFHYDEDPNAIKEFADATGPGEPERYREDAHTIQVASLPDQQLSVETDQINLYLRGDRKTASVDEAAILQFSSANLSTDKTLIAQLLLEIPTGLRVQRTSFDSGSSQFTSRYEVSPGETKGDSIQIAANEPGSYEIRGRAVYKLGEGGEANSSSQRISLQFTPS